MEPFLTTLGLVATGAAVTATLGSLVAPYLARAAAGVVQPVSEAASAAWAAISNIFKGSEPALEKISPELAEINFEELQRQSLARMPSGWEAKKWIEYGTTAFGTAMFLEFIIEEAIQAVSMGVWQLTSNKFYDEAKKMIGFGKWLVNALKTVCFGGSAVNPISSAVFLTYAAAAEHQLNAFEKIAEQAKKGKQPGGYERMSGGIYDMR